jgi:hypothetical protein
MLAQDRHYLVTSGMGDHERIVFGWNLPLTQKAANGFKRSHGGRVIKRTTAKRLGLI